LLLFSCKYPCGVTKGDSLSYDLWSIISSNSFVWSSWPTWPSPSFLDHGFWKEDGNSSVFLVLWFIAFFLLQCLSNKPQEASWVKLRGLVGGREGWGAFPKLQKRLSCHTIIYLLFFFFFFDMGAIIF
jgi:hypothetical protein